MIKTVHTDIALWSYERPSRGYFGYHLRPKSSLARKKLYQKLYTTQRSEPLLLRFGAQLDDPISAGWSRTAYDYLALMRGDVPARFEDGVQLAIPEDSWGLLLSLLARSDAQEEDSVNVITPSGHVPLWIWSDAA
ncbi:unnamed protein product [Ectocarpus sp. 12 AP-2014]